MNWTGITKLSGVLGLALLLLAVAPVEAHAKRGVAVFNTGEDIFEAGPLPSSLANEPELAGAVAGFKCEVFGLFWAYIHWGSCTPVAFLADGDGYWDHAEISDLIGAEYTQSDMKMGFWAQFGRWVYLLLIVGPIAAFVIGRRRGDDDSGDGVREHDDASVASAAPLA
jgi:hypothetical protein